MKAEITVSGSTVLDDPDWDHFLDTTPLGEIQQTCAWARYKRIDGWECSRTVLKMNQHIAGGFQVLWKPTRLGRIGYVTKGPVAACEENEIVDTLIGQLTLAARKLHLKAVVFQPPRTSRNFIARLPRSHFSPTQFMSIINTTLMVDVSAGIPEVEKRMNKTWRKHIRQAIRQGVTIREGTESHLGDFFQLMLKTCERQGVSPNPANESALREIWRNLGGNSRCRLVFADLAGQTVAGLFCFYFKDVVKMWKKGSMTQDIKSHPMELLYYDTFRWAHSKGFRYCDLTSLDRGIAQAMIQGLPLSKEQKASRDFFHMGLGGQPVFMPDSFVYIPNTLVRWGFRALVSNRHTLSYLKKHAATM
jgi:hypothetical protein